MRREMRGHPLMLLDALYPYLFFLILPTVRGLIHFFRTGQYGRLLVGEVVTLAVVLAAAAGKWRRFRLTVESDGGLHIRTGLFYRREVRLPPGRISCWSFSRRPLQSLFRAVTVQIHTEAGPQGKADFRFRISTRDYRTLLRILPRSAGAVTYRAGLSGLLLRAAATSSAVSGILLGVPFLNKTAKLLGDGVRERFFSRLNEVSSRFRLVPPIVNAVTLLLVGAYLLSFTDSLIRSLRYRVRLGRDDITVSSGLLSRRETVFRKAAVNTLTVLQTPLLRLTGHRLLRVGVAGCGEKKEESAVLLPAAREEKLRAEMAAIFGLRPDPVPAVRPPAGSPLRFLYRPLAALALLPVVTLPAARALPAFRELLLFLLLAALLLTLYFATLDLHAWRCGGLTLRPDCVSACGVRRLSTCELHCRPERVGVWRIRTFPGGRRSDRCSVKITVRSQSAESLNVRQISRSALFAQLRERFGADLPIVAADSAAIGPPA